MTGPTPFIPPRGGQGSQAHESQPVPSAFWQPPEAVQASPFWPFQRGGVFLGWVGDTPVGVKDDRHLVTVAGARAGKSSTVLIPNLHLYESSVLVIDPKGELATLTAAWRADKLGQAVHVLDPWGVADVRDDLRASFDPLSELRHGDPDNLVDDAALVSEALIQEAGENNSHWTESSRNFITALGLWMMYGAHSETFTLADLPGLLAAAAGDGRDEGKADADDTPTLFEAMAWMQTPAGNGLPPGVLQVIREAGEGMLGTPAKERGSILSTARNQLSFLSSPPLGRSLAASSFRLADLKAKPTTVYLCLPASRMGTHARWLRLVLNMAMASLEREPTREGAPPVLLMLEEFAALGHMRSLEQASAYMAGFGVKLWAVLQDLTQLKRHYAEGWETFLGNAGMVQAFGNADQTTLDYLSKRLGETAVYLEESHGSNEHAARGGDNGTRKNFQRVPLLAPHELALEFGRRNQAALCLAADGPPVAVSRRFIDDPAFAPLLERVAK